MNDIDLDMIYSRKAVQRLTVIMIDLKGLGLNEDEIFYCLEEASKILPNLFNNTPPMP